MSFGSKVADARKKLNMTQEQLADLLEVTRQTISRWESDIVYPDMEKIVRLSSILDVSCDYLLKDNGKEIKSTLITRLLLDMKDKYVTIEFLDDMEDYELYQYKVMIIDFDNSWVRVRLEPKKKKGNVEEKLISLSSISAIRLEAK